MPRPKQKLSNKDRELRKEIIDKIDGFEPIPPLTREFISTNGFINYYLQIRELYDSYTSAYEALEEHYIRITGHRRYSDLDSLRRAITRM